MRPNRLQLSPRHRAWLYSTFAGLFLSGAGWWVLHRWLQLDTGFGPQPHPAQRWLIALHGAAAMLALVVIGTLVPLHVRRALHARRNLPNGSLLLSFLFLLTVSGYALYYSGGEALRAAASSAHIVLGWLLPALLVWHIIAGRRTRDR